MADSLNEMKNNKFEYFLNAILYCLYLNEVWSNRKIDKIVNTIIPRAMKVKFNRQQRKEAEDFKYGSEAGLSIGVANHLYGFFYTGYPSFLSFVLLGIADGGAKKINMALVAILVAIPIGFFYIPAYKAVFSNDRYLNYFKQFKKEDEQWHRKWNRRTIAFCVGSVVFFLSGIFAMWWVGHL